MDGNNSDVYDVYIDLSDTRIPPTLLDRHVAACATLLQPHSGQRITGATQGYAVVLRDHQIMAPPERSSALAHAIELAHIDNRGLWIIRGPWLPGRTDLDGIAAMADIDPNIGMLQPRFTVGGKVIALPATGDQCELLEKEVMGLLPDKYVLPELQAPCVFITPQGVHGCDSRTADGTTSVIGMLERLRRRGFRNVVFNRSLVDYQLPAKNAYVLGATDSSAWVVQSDAVRLERLLAAGFVDGRRRLLLDCRGMTPTHNGSAHAILGYLEGVSSISSEWKVTVCVGGAASAFHRLTERFADFEYVLDRPLGGYLVAIHLSQPWSVTMIKELHESAPLVAFDILDTIAWDAIYPAPPDLDVVTRLAARFADGLLYISGHSRDRFRFRFQPGAAVHEAVTYLSTQMNTSAGEPSPGTGRHILVVGNSMEHKDVDWTAEKIAQSFPSELIVAFGAQASSRSNVRALPSGFVSDRDVTQLFDEARVIVFPSFSEGFGMPVIEALARDKRVVVRRLPLWDEIRLRTGAGDRLEEFQTDAELVDAIARALTEGHRNDSATDNGIPPVTWADCGRTLLEFADVLVERFNYEHWQDRDLALRWIP